MGCASLSALLARPSPASYGRPPSDFAAAGTVRSSPRSHGPAGEQTLPRQRHYKGTEAEQIWPETEQGMGVAGVIEGSSPKGVEGPEDNEWRHSLLRKIVYKR